MNKVKTNLRRMYMKRKSVMYQGAERDYGTWNLKKGRFYGKWYKS